MRAAAPFGRVSRAGRAESYPVRVSPFRRLVRPPRGGVGVLCSCQGACRLPCRGAGLSAACGGVAVIPSFRGGACASPSVVSWSSPCGGCLSWSSAVPGLVRRVPRGVSHPLLSRSVVVAARVRRCSSVSWRPCRRACGGLPSGLCRWPYLACAWRLAPPGCLWRPCRRGPGVRGVSASRPSVSLRYHFFRRLSNVKSTNDFVTLLCVYDKCQNIKMAVLLLFRALRRAHIVEARFRRVRVACCVPAFPARRCSSLSEWQALDAAAAAGIGSAGGWLAAGGAGGIGWLLARSAGSAGRWLALLAAGGSAGRWRLCWPLAALLAAGASAGGWRFCWRLWRRLAGSAGRWRLCWRLALLLAALAAAGGSAGRWLALLAAGGSAGRWRFCWRLWRRLAGSAGRWRLWLAAGWLCWPLAALLAAGGSAGGWRFCWRLALLLAALAAAGGSAGRWLALLAAGASAGRWRALLAAGGSAGGWRLWLAAGVLCWLLALLLAAGASAGGWRFCWRLAALAGGSAGRWLALAGCWRFCWLLAGSGWLLAVLAGGWRLWLAVLLAAGAPRRRSAGLSPSSGVSFSCLLWLFDNVRPAKPRAFCAKGRGGANRGADVQGTAPPSRAKRRGF